MTAKRLSEDKLDALMHIYTPISHEEVLSLVAEVRAARSVDAGEGVVERVTKLHDAHSEAIRRALTSRESDEARRLALEVIAEEARNLAAQHAVGRTCAAADLLSLAEFAEDRSRE